VRPVVLLIVLAALVGIAVWLFVAKDEAPASSDSAPPPTASSGGAAPDDRPRPSLPNEQPAIAEPGGSASEYTVGGMQVRDHRGGDQPKIDVPLNVHPPGSHELASSVVNDVAQQVRRVLADCASSLPREARGDKPKMQGQLVVAVKGEQLTVTGATVQLRDVFGAGLEPTRQCIEQRSIGLHAAAAGEPDLDGYSIAVSFVLQ
jgi:hypothetical protein